MPWSRSTELRSGFLDSSRLGLAVSQRASTACISRLYIASCHWVAQRSASTTLENSTRKPSPVVLTMRPRCSLMYWSISSALIDLSRLRVPSSSAPISLEYPATSARGLRQDGEWWSFVGETCAAQTSVQRRFGQPHVTRIGDPGHLGMIFRQRIDLWFEPHCLGKSAPRVVDIALEP
jgi:hypothetical protein